MRNLQTFFLLLLAAILNVSYAQTEAYQFSRIDVNKGLSHNQVNTILKDSRGFLWFGTLSGLNRYDGYKFKVYRNLQQDSTSISDNYIEAISEGPGRELWINTRNGINVYDPVTETFNRNPSLLAISRYHLPDGNISAVFKDRGGNFWFLHAAEGLYQFSPRLNRTEKIRSSSTGGSAISTSRIASITQDPAGNLWLLHADGVLEQLDSSLHQVKYRTSVPGKKGQLSNYTFLCDRDGDLWMFQQNAADGLHYFNATERKFSLFSTEHGTTKLNTNILKGIQESDDGKIWVATDHGGINVIDKRNFSVQYLLNTEDEKSLSQNSINSIYKDVNGIIWIGTYKKGISFYHDNIIRFPSAKRALGNNNSLPHEDINSFAEDKKGNLWIGTNGGGLLYYDRQSNRYRRFVHQPGNVNSLSNDVIVSLFIDRQDKLWIGTYYGGLNCYDGNKFIRYKHDPSNASSLSDDRVYSILEDKDGVLWIGTLGGGLDQFISNTGGFKNFSTRTSPAIHSDYISSLIQDRSGNIWIGTAHGVEMLDKRTGRFTYYSSDNSGRSISNNNVASLYEDARGWIWIGTREGLNMYNPASKAFRTFTRFDGLPDNMITGILDDSDKNIWVSTANGVSSIKINGEGEFSFRNYDELDGLQGKLFNANSAFRTSRGELLFGGGDGYNIIDPSKIGINKTIPPVVLTDFQLFNKSVATGEMINGKLVLPRSMPEINEIVLPYSSNFFSIEFAALNFFHPEKNQYKYKLEGLNEDWLAAENNVRKATFTNLDPGTYTFKVKAANNDGIWNEEGASLKITILPPFWKTPLAFVIYFLVIVGALLLSRRLILERERLKYKIEHDRQEALRLHELDVMKIRFFTNISHEFRTPLTLILSPLDKLVKSTTDPSRQRHLVMIYRNARRLLNLVNQLLDFRRLELDEISLNPTKGEIIGFIKEISYSFSDLSEKKNIHFSFNTATDSLQTWFDHDKVEKIMFNLLSNAFKFTPEDGEVEVELDVEETNEEDLINLIVKVKDTGIGIPEENQEKIFERFFQNDVPRSIVNQGSGIGLAITKEFVKLHSGTILVDSELERGTTFTIKLPVRKVLMAENFVLPVTDKPTAASDRKETSKNIADPNKPKILLVEDNEDFRFYLKDNLRQYYQIIEASNGKQGFKQVLDNLPDLVVSDVAMPEMDGMELCRKIRHDPRSKHIPVILLTARSAEEHQLEGLDTGANDFITKPFNFELLQSRIRNLINQKQSLQKAFEKQVSITATNVEVASADEKLVQKALAVVEKNIDNPDFSVEELSRVVCMSRVGLYKKLVAITGKTPIEFIRTIRLKRAAQLLAKSQMTVAEVAYEVGFNNPKYFTKYFKKEFGVIPSNYHGEKKTDIDTGVSDSQVF